MVTKSKKGTKEIFSFIVEIGMLMQMPRSHKKYLGNTFDTVSSHSHHTAVIGYCLTRMEGLSHQEGLKSLAMGVLHDNAEARTGDLDFVAKHYASTDEAKALNHQLYNLPFAKDLKEIFAEYEERETLVSKCAKDADVLQQMYQEWILSYTGNKMAEKWLLGDYRTRVPSFRTKSAKKLALMMKNSHPHQWWYEELVETNLNKDFLNGDK